MSWHRDKEVNQAIIRLMDTLCTWERETGRGSVLLLVPDTDDEKLLFAMDGKPINSIDPVSLGVQLEILKHRISEVKRNERV